MSIPALIASKKAEIYEECCALIYGLGDRVMDCKGVKDCLLGLRSSILWFPKLEGLLGEAHLSLGEHRAARQCLKAAHAQGDLISSMLLVGHFVGSSAQWPSQEALARVPDTETAHYRWRYNVALFESGEKVAVDVLLDLEAQGVCAGGRQLSVDAPDRHPDSNGEKTTTMDTVLRTCAARNDVVALLYLAEQRPQELQRNPGLPNEFATRAHELGSAEATWMLAETLVASQNAVADRDRGWLLCKQATKQGNSNAQLLLARAYSEGFCSSIPKNARRALKDAVNVAKRGYCESTWNAWSHAALYASYCEDRPREFKYARRAYSRGGAIAGTRLGNCYLHGYGVERDVQRGIQMLTAASGAGSCVASQTLGSFYTRLGATSAEQALGLQWHLEGHHRKNAWCSLALAECHAKGWGTPVDAELADSYLQDALIRAPSLLSDEFKHGCSVVEKLLTSSHAANIGVAIDKIDPSDLCPKLLSKLTEMCILPQALLRVVAAYRGKKKINRV